MGSVRDFFINNVNKVSKVVSARWLISSTNQKFVLPFYHAVSDEKLPHIEQLYRVKNTSEFEKDLDFLLRHFTPVDFLQFKEIATSGARPRKPVFLLSFDDGFREFHDVIAPMLLKKGIPAVCFLNSAFIDNKDLFFRYKASLLHSHFPQLLSIDYNNRQKIDEYASKIDFSFQKFLLSSQPYLTSPQIEKLIRDGFHFGAHSIDHPEYRFIPFEEQLRQTSESIQFIKNKFGLNYSLFSFPFTDYGVSDRFLTTITNEKLVDVSFGGAGLKIERYPLHFQRIAFERGMLSAEEIYKTELLYSSLLRLTGRNVIHRK
jgi:peptidoglycan/xylan/chitin deacetylase (PgdA/CDA1 family)